MTNSTTGSCDDVRCVETATYHARLSTKRLLICGVMSWLCYLGIAFSARSLHESNSHDSGLIVLLALFGVAFGLYLTALRIAVNAATSHRLLTILWVGAVAFRMTLLLSDPIEEIDLYRYLWDGTVSNAGISPFRYAPHQVIGSSSTDSLPEDLGKLVRIRETSPELAAILKRVHFGELPTIYPPVSQVVFAACSWMTPQDSSVSLRMTFMKAWFVAFDLVTLSSVLWLLRLANRNLGWGFAYGWCPLVVKEIANSGHLDSLAICLTTLALASTVLALRSTADSVRCRRLVIGSAVSLGLGVGAKLYPVVLAPLLFWAVAKRVSLVSGMLWCVIFGSVVATVLWPMMPTSTTQAHTSLIEPIVVPSEDLPPLPPSETPITTRDPSESLQAFLSRWEMNDFLFLLVVENLRPTVDLEPDQVAWFTVTPSWWRSSLMSKVESFSGLPANRIPFILTRALLSAVFLLLACCLAFCGVAKPSGTATDDTPAILNAAFLTLAWFWLLLPTQNPWYLVWCLPLVPFVRGGAWLMLSGLAFTYYLRFWMTAQFPTPMLGTAYSGPQFFDFVVTWIEYGPWLLWLMFSWATRKWLIFKYRPVGAGLIRNDLGIQR